MSIYYRYKPVIQILVCFTSLFPNFLLRFFWYLLEPFPGVIFVLFRYLILCNICKSVGDNVYVANYVELRFPEKLALGSNVSIQRNCYIDAIGGIQIGNDVSIAHQTSLLSFDHGWDDLNIPIRKNPLIYGAISIANDVWIGAGVRLTAGSSIAERNIVAAGAVITKNSDQESEILLAGIPAKKIKKLGQIS